jgi:hypothetical protein
MKKAVLIFILSTVLSVFATTGIKKFTLNSRNFKDGNAIPLKFTKAFGGENISPQLAWKNPPAGTKSYVITCIDIHPVAQNWVHWITINIPANVSSIDEDASCGSMPKGAKELNNSFKAKGWGGPRPPAGTGVHQYVFTIYALDKAVVKTRVKLLSEEKLLRLLKGKILGKASIIGTYQQK